MLDKFVNSPFNIFMNTLFIKHCLIVQDYVVTFDVEESKRITGSVNTLVGNNEVMII